MAGLVYLLCCRTTSPWRDGSLEEDECPKGRNGVHGPKNPYVGKNCVAKGIVCGFAANGAGFKGERFMWKLGQLFNQKFMVDFIKVESNSLKGVLFLVANANLRSISFPYPTSEKNFPRQP